MFIYDFDEIKWLELYPDRTTRIQMKFAYIKTTEHGAWFEFKEWDGKMDSLIFPKIAKVENEISRNYEEHIVSRCLALIREIALHGIEEKYLHPIREELFIIQDNIIEIMLRGRHYVDF